MNVSTRLRHGVVPRAAGRVRRHRAVQLPGDDPDGLDDAALHHHRQHLRAEGRQHGAADARCACSSCCIEAGLPERRGQPGHLHAATRPTCLLAHPDVKGISFVGSTSVGLHIYKTAAANGKRVQALTEAKNHALVLEDCVLERTVRGIINSTYGCAGQRCMALPVVCVEEAIADEFVAMLSRFAPGAEDRPGLPARNPSSGPWSRPRRRQSVTSWIETGREGRRASWCSTAASATVPGYERRFLRRARRSSTTSSRA